jgi:hypothetical protein
MKETVYNNNEGRFLPLEPSGGQRLECGSRTHPRKSLQPRTPYRPSDKPRNLTSFAILPTNPATFGVPLPRIVTCFAILPANLQPLPVLSFPFPTPKRYQPCHSSHQPRTVACFVIPLTNLQPLPALFSDPQTPLRYLPCNPTHRPVTATCSAIPPANPAPLPDLQSHPPTQNR